jgi:hypothetical protein
VERTYQEALKPADGMPFAYLTGNALRVRAAGEIGAG